MKIVDTDLVTFLLLKIEATKMQLDLSNRLYDALPDTRTLSASIQTRKKILEYQSELLVERGKHIETLLKLENELKEVLP
ncbi:MAG: hypothetical protein EKK57_07805 [Proteobacteria bacterium]|nr:MAG: hypothetical protein EKK57_07805 [Pseudomonadota bacterium]